MYIYIVGESDLIVQVIQCVKSSQSLKKVTHLRGVIMIKSVKFPLLLFQAIDVLIEAYPAQNISAQFLLELLNMSLSRLHPKSEGTCNVSYC